MWSFANFGLLGLPRGRGLGVHQPRVGGPRPTSLSLTLWVCRVILTTALRERRCRGRGWAIGAAFIVLKLG